jgi:hypothetical protein
MSGSGKKAPAKVYILAIGEKHGNRLQIGGEEVKL